MNRFMSRIFGELICNRANRKSTTRRRRGNGGIEPLERRLLLTVTTTYGLDFVQNADLQFADGNTDSTGLADGGYAVIGNHSGDHGDDHIDGAIFNAAGIRTNEFSLVPGTNGAVDQLKNGNLVVASETDGSILLTIIDPQSGRTVGTVSSSAPQLIGFGNRSFAPDVEALTNGNFVVVNTFFTLTSPGSIQVRLYDSSGGNFRSLIIPTPTQFDSAARVAVLDNGNFVVAWQNTLPSKSVWYAIYNSTGDVVKPATPIQTNGTAQGNITVAATLGGFALAFEDNGWNGDVDITLARFTSSGRLLDLHDVSGNRVADADPILTRMANGMLAVAYSSVFGSSDIYVRLIDSATGKVLATHLATSGESLQDETNLPSLVSFGVGQLAAFWNNATDEDVDGAILVGLRYSVSDADSDIIIGDDFIDVMTGGDGDDTLIGKGGNDFLSGGSGRDILNGGNNDDTLYGGIDADLLDGGQESDYLAGGTGDDIYKFGIPLAGEDDTLVEYAEQGTDTLNFSAMLTKVTLDLGFAGTQIQKVHTNRTITLNRNNTFENAIGGTAADTLIGNSAKNILTGLGGDDILDGAGGSDTLVGGTGDDFYVFGPANSTEVDVLRELPGQGTDSIYFGAISANIAINLGQAGSQRIHTNRSISLNLDNTFENAVGGSGNDVLRGNSSNNILIGNAGNDLLVGLNGNDNLSGGSGNDILIGGRGQDILNGDQGQDLLVAGFTRSDGIEDNSVFLEIVKDKWSDALPIHTRVAALSLFLVPRTTLINDSSIDMLTSTGDQSFDWLFAAFADYVLRDEGDLIQALGI